MTVSAPPPASASAASTYGDIAGGITTFFTMAYIVVVNPAILSTPGTGITFTGALCFLPRLFIAPLAAAVPAYATAAVLVLVGLSMFQMVGGLDFLAVVSVGLLGLESR